MPRRKRTDDEVFPLPGMPDDLDRDPEPGATAPARRRPGRPAGTGRIAARGPGGRITSKAQTLTKVKAEIEFILTMSQGMWALGDPECAKSATEESISAAAQAITNMIARKPAMLEFVATTGVLTDILALGIAVKPIVATVWKAHGPGGAGHGPEKGETIDYGNYPAFTGAGA